jgi:hypothetical protein
MKTTQTFVLVLAGLTVALVAGAVTPTPKPTSSPNPSLSGTPPALSKVSPTPSAKISPTPAEVLPSPHEQAAMASTPVIQANLPPPKPVLFLLRTEAYTANGKNWIRYRYDVFNKSDYPADMFAAAPSLPPCGSNTNASRTWVDFFDSTGKRLYGFCALSKPADLGLLWFALEEGVVPPSYVYIELNDRQTNTKYKSNLADTTP